MSESTAVIERREHDAKTAFGFWMYIMTDCVLFATLFAVFAVLRNNTFGGPSGRELFDMPYVLGETLFLLTSSFTCGLAMLAVQRKDRPKVLFWLAVTFLFGTAFLVLELTEFRHLVIEGNGWRRSGFLSSYFTLVGTHGFHIIVGLLWMGVLMVKVRAGLTGALVRRLTLFSLFWHFLDVVWIFIFTIVYAIGVA